MATADTHSVTGLNGLRGTLLDRVPPPGNNDRLRVQVTDGPVIEIPASALQHQEDGTYCLPVSPADVEQARQANPDSTVIPILQEELVVGKKPVPTGGVRVNRRVEEHEELVDIPLRKERVDVRRVLIDREVEGPLPVRREGDTTIVPVVEEVLVVTKKFVLKEEVHITRRAHEEHHQERVTVQRQEAEIQEVDAEGKVTAVDTPAAHKPVSSSTAPQRKRKSILG